MSEATHDAQTGYKSYLTGFAWSVLLTAVPFGLVLSEAIDSKALVISVIFLFGAAQMLVHIHYFLHVSLKAEQGWQFMSLLFTIVMLVIILAGSAEVMFHLRENMMPGHEQVERVRELP
ncbi:MAG: cytochrome o ubiquinol oxidase subunit IV [Pseudomonadota bacterium]